MNTKIVEQYLHTLPDNVAKAIENFKWTDVCVEIGEKFHLQIDELEVFKKETLLIAVGAEPASKYQNNLALRMGIPTEIAGQIVDEANDHIFSVLQKMAFTKQEPETHNEIKNTLKEEGIEIIHDEETLLETDLQNLADSLLGNTNTKEYIIKETEEISKTAETETPKKPEAIQYQEPIELSDLAGVSKHRTPYTHHESAKIPDTNLSKSLYEKSHLATESSIDVSPSKQEQIKENGDFLRHIGALPEKEEE